MNCTNRKTAWGAMSFTAIAGCLLYAIFAVAATDQQCVDAWDDAPAEAYCPAESPKAMAATDENTCLVAASACSIAVQITLLGGADDGSDLTEEWTLTPTFPSAWTLLSSSLSLDDTDDIDICITGSGPVAAKVRTACLQGELDSATAVKDGRTRDTG